jgi:O-6-methylguanine DNA methyltransferase
LKLHRREFSSGPLTVAAELDAAGRLHSVALPAKIPAGLLPAHLSAVIFELERHPLFTDDASPFRLKAWRRMRKIPWGSALTYSELAAELGSPRGMRAVGGACAANPLPLVIPCHRVLATSGMGGFACGLAWKARLLELETEPRPAA